MRKRSASSEIDTKKTGLGINGARSYVRSNSLTRKDFKKLEQVGFSEEATKSGSLLKVENQVIGGAHKKHGSSKEKFDHRNATIAKLLQEEEQKSNGGLLDTVFVEGSEGEKTNTSIISEKSLEEKETLNFKKKKRNKK